MWQEGARTPQQQKDATVIKYTVASGSQSWAKSYNGKGEFTDKVQAIVADSKKNTYVTGYVFNSEKRRDLFVARLNPTGSTLWFRTYDFAQDNDEGKAITLDPSGNVFVCGNSIGNGTSDDYITIKFDSLVIHFGQPATISQMKPMWQLQSELIPPMEMYSLQGTVIQIHLLRYSITISQRLSIPLLEMNPV
jgi:hypothetical protein